MARKRDPFGTWAVSLDQSHLASRLLRSELDSIARQQLAKIALETAEQPPVTPGAAAGGDPGRLRGLPAIAKGVTGTMPGSDPLGETLRRERDRERTAIDEVEEPKPDQPEPRN
jgi:hypothetical protein